MFKKIRQSALKISEEVRYNQPANTSDENEQKHLNHQFYKEANEYRENIRIGQIVKGAHKYPEPFTTSSWSNQQIIDHAMQENVDQAHYIYAAAERMQVLEQRIARLTRDIYVLHEDIKSLRKKNRNAKDEISKLKSLSRVSKNLQLEAENLKLAQQNDELSKAGKKVMINNLCKESYLIAKSKGWHDEPREMGTILALIHSEVSEALEADRKGDKENFVEELADVCIRIFDLCGANEIDLESAISNKMEFNKTRTYKHGGKAY